MASIAILNAEISANEPGVYSASRYPGYPVTLALINPDAESLTVSVDAIDRAPLSYATNEVHSTITIPGDYTGARITITAAKALIVVFEDECIPDNPFYIRWINRIAGYEYKMFSGRVRSEVEVEERQNVQHAVTFEDEIFSQSMIGATAREYITAGDEGLSREEFDRLAGIFRAPVIEWYDEETQTWTPLIISDSSSSEWDGGTSLGSLEFVFTKPRILLQF